MKKSFAITGFILLAVFLYAAFQGYLVLPQTFSFGPLNIHYYGLTMAAAVWSGYALAKRSASRHGMGERQFDDLAFWLIISSFVGARLYHVLSSLPYYLENPVDVLKVWNGGLGVYGAMFAGMLVLWFFAKRNRLSVLSLFDWLAPSLVLGQIVGRFGNLFNYEAYGYPSDLPWKMYVPPEFRTGNLAADFYHPLFLYEAIGNALILAVLLKLGSRLPKPGLLFFTYFLLYNVLRFFLEFIRVDSTFVGAFRLNVLVSFGLILVTLPFFVKYLRNNASKHP